MEVRSSRYFFFACSRWPAFFLFYFLASRNVHFVCSLAGLREKRKCEGGLEEAADREDKCEEERREWEGGHAPIFPNFLLGTAAATFFCA
jgi:hypothetical protein